MYIKIEIRENEIKVQVIGEERQISAHEALECLKSVRKGVVDEAIEQSYQGILNQTLDELSGAGRA